MRVSYSWLQHLLGDRTPSPKEVEDLITFHAFEIEGVEETDTGTVFDIDVLPNRAHDCLCHRGIAKEIAVNANVPFPNDPLKKDIDLTLESNVLAVSIDDQTLCRRYTAAVIENIEVGPSPAWLQEWLTAIGQKPINNIVDATNYVMFAIGQPLHAFDADKLTKRDGAHSIRVRSGTNGESITTLDGDEKEVDESVLLITDGNSDAPIGLAGIKGGQAAEIDEKTQSVVIESANFHPTRTRKSAQRLKLHTDASKRFENEIHPELTAYGISEVASLITKIAGGRVEGYVDEYPNPMEKREVHVTTDEVNRLLGTDMSDEDVAATLDRFSFQYTGQFSVTVPFERMDIVQGVDLVEEIGRVYGYDTIESNVPGAPSEKPRVNKAFYYMDAVRDALVDIGFSEVYTYALQKKGDIEIANPLASDKSHMRKNLYKGISQSLAHNAHYLDLLALPDIRIFEIGRVFPKSDEHLSLALGVYQSGKKVKSRDVISDALSAVSGALGVDVTQYIERDEQSGGDAVVEIHFDKVIDALGVPDSYVHTQPQQESKRFTPISPYPFVLRDIAVWMPKGSSSDELLSLIREHAGDLLANWRLFDIYEKDDAVSYAFRLAFLSHEKTLSDTEVNEVMDRIYEAVAQKGWEVR